VTITVATDVNQSSSLTWQRLVDAYDQSAPATPACSG
jgi:hypothetical protein